MTRALILEDFGPVGHGRDAISDAVPAPKAQAPVDGGPVALTARTAALEDAADAGPEGADLEAFEQGYRSGWDDCIANEQEERRRIGADLAKALSEAALMAEAVRAEMLSGLAPLLEQIARQLLPAMAADAILPQLCEEVDQIARTHVETHLEILASPAACPAIERLLSGGPVTDLAVTPEPAFADGQVVLRFAGQRREIDLSGAVVRMSEAIRAFSSDASRGSVFQSAPEREAGAA